MDKDLGNMTSTGANPWCFAESGSFDGNWSNNHADPAFDNLEQRQGSVLYGDAVASAEDLGGNNAGVVDDDLDWTAFLVEYVKPNADGGSPQGFVPSNSHDPALGLDNPGEGKENPLALTSGAQADHRGADKIGCSDDSRLLHGEGLGSDPKSDCDAIDHNFEEGSVQEESRETLDRTHGQDSLIARTNSSGMGDNLGLRQSNEEELCVSRSRSKDWSPSEIFLFFNTIEEAVESGLRRGQVLWDFCSGVLRDKHKISRSAKACNNLWDTCKKHYEAITKHGPCSFWDMEEGERIENKLPRVFEREWYDTMGSFYQKKLCLTSRIRRTRPTRGIAVHESLVVGVRNGDKDLPGTKKSHLAIKISDMISLTVDEVVEPSLELCGAQLSWKEIVKRTGQQVKQEVETVVDHEIKPALESQLLAKGANVGDVGHRLFVFHLKTHIRKEVESAFERSGIPSFLLAEAEKEQELLCLRERNCALEKKIKSGGRHQGRPRGGKRPKLRTQAKLQDGQQNNS